MKSEKVIEELYDNGEKIGLGLAALTGLSFLIGALRSAHRGDFAAATFKAVVWAGLSNNISNQTAFRLACDNYVSKDNRKKFSDLDALSKRGV